MNITSSSPRHLISLFFKSKQKPCWTLWSTMGCLPSTSKDHVEPFGQPWGAFHVQAKTLLNSFVKPWGAFQVLAKTMLSPLVNHEVLSMYKQKPCWTLWSNNGVPHPWIVKSMLNSFNLKPWGASPGETQRNFPYNVID